MVTVGKASIKASSHYDKFHSDVKWHLVLKAILSPTKTHPNKRHGKNRFTYIKRFKEFVIEIHAEKDTEEDAIIVINAFKVRR